FSTTALSIFRPLPVSKSGRSENRASHAACDGRSPRIGASRRGSSELNAARANDDLFGSALLFPSQTTTLRAWRLKPWAELQAQARAARARLLEAVLCRHQLKRVSAEACLRAANGNSGGPRLRTLIEN